MNLWDNPLYREDLRRVAELPLPWEHLSGKTVLISGATGMIGRFLSDAFMYKNITEGLSCRICALGRSQTKAEERFCAYWHNDLFQYICQDINEPIADVMGEVDYILHLASNTHPVAYSTDPIGTITANIIGTKNLLDLASAKKSTRFLFASSVEIYGENRGDAERFDEHYCGYIDCNTMRAGYPESKRCGEALCQAYIRQKGIDAVIVRLPRTFGPTMQMSDSKAIAQFIKKAVAHEDIVLKSAGNQFYSYAYVADAAAGLLYGLLKGKCGEAYNVADERCNITLKELAETIAGYAGTKVVLELPDDVERAGYSNATKAVLDGRKLETLGWRGLYDLETGIGQTILLLGENV